MALNAHMIATGALHGTGSSDGTISMDGSGAVRGASIPGSTRLEEGFL
jgi:hypothetical protein